MPWKCGRRLFRGKIFLTPGTRLLEPRNRWRHWPRPTTTLSTSPRTPKPVRSTAAVLTPSIAPPPPQTALPLTSHKWSYPPCLSTKNSPPSRRPSAPSWASPRPPPRLSPPPRSPSLPRHLRRPRWTPSHGPSRTSPRSWPRWAASPPTSSLV
jgi:hypothetical protein